MGQDDFLKDYFDKTIMGQDDFLKDYFGRTIKI